MTDLGEIASLHAAAALELDAAKRALALDKAGRRGSILGRAVDFFADTAAEKRLESAEEAMADARSTSMSAVKAFLESRVATLVADDGTDTEAWNNQSKRTEIASTAFAAAERAGLLAVVARDALEEAGKACSSASTMEMMDAVSSNKGIALMSTVSNGTAKAKLSAAKEAVAELRGAVEAARTLTADVNVPDDMVDLVFDFAIDMPFDVFSFINMGKLSGAADGCRKAADGVSSVIPALEAEIAARAEAMETEKAALLVIELPYLRAAIDLVPYELAFAVPETGPSTQPSRGPAPGYGA